MKKRQAKCDFKTKEDVMTNKLKFICQVLKEMKLEVKTRKVIAKNASKGKK